MTRSNTLAVVCALSAAGLAFGQKDGRPVPGNGVIDMPGFYALRQDQFASAGRPGVLITASNVSLDLNGMTIMGPGGKMGTGIEIRGANGVRISNGFLANHAFGVVVVASNNVVLTGLQITGQGLPVVAPPPETGIMIMQSKNVVVEGNNIFNTGLGIFVRGGMSGGNRIAGNTITAGTNGILGICYNPGATGTEGPVGDLIYGNVIHGFGISLQASPGSRYNVFKANTLFFRETAVDLQNPTNQDMDNQKVMVP